MKSETAQADSWQQRHVALEQENDHRQKILAARQMELDGWEKRRLAEDESLKVKWSHVTKVGERGHPEGKAVVYHFVGRDSSGNRCEMLVDRTLGSVVEFKRTLPFDKAKKALPGPA